MRQKIQVLFLCVVIVSSINGEDNLKKLVQDVEKKLKSVKTMKVTFEETYIWELTGEAHVLRGELLMSDNDRFRVTTEDQIIVSDGQKLWTYSKPSHRVLVDQLSESKNALLPKQILFRYTRDFQMQSLGVEDIQGTHCEIIEFTNEEGDVFIPKVKVWIDKKAQLPKKIEQIDVNDNKSIYLLLSIEMNANVDENSFHFNIPENAEVIEMD